LLDTHAYLWWLQGGHGLGKAARASIAEPTALVYVSAASIWEAAIEVGLGRLEVDGADLVAEIVANGFSELPISARHAQRAGALPDHHHDPFDRLLVAQSQLEDLRLVTRDSVFARYGVDVVW
jgi:PIN domain nuclease of toxin-antitoxin system